MRIAQVAPLYESVPPKLYGGTERVVSWLTEELVRQGHDVTLFASGDSETAAHLVPVCDRALWHDERCRETLPHHVREMQLVMDAASRFDVIHFHTDYLQFPLIHGRSLATVTTLHGELNPIDHLDLFEMYPDIPVVSISDSQRRSMPGANWRATIHHGLPRDLHPYSDQPGDYVAFLGRASKEKGLDRAIEIAVRARVKLRVAVKVYREERAYYTDVIEPLVREAGPWVEMVGEVGGAEKDRFLGGARALLFPIDWQEPFGLVMAESLACGTPVVAWRNGSVEEVVEDGVTGFIVDSLEEAVAATGEVDRLSRKECRRAFEERFDVSRMTREYLSLYKQTIAATLPKRRRAADEEALVSQVRSA